MSHDKTLEAANFPEEVTATAPSRREVMRRAAILTGGAALLVANVISSDAVADAAKMSKAAAAYQDTPKGEQNCANCSLFVAPTACGVVEGTISSSGWCKLYQKKG
jgi:hypothetical protein